MKKTTVEIPLANKDGKSVKLELDHNTHAVAITLPITLSVPRVDVNALARAVYELQEDARA